MRIKLDENLPLQIASRLNALGHDVHTAFGEGLSGCMDGELWEAAQREERFLITQDLDFSDTQRFLPGTHHGILLLRLHSPSKRSLLQRIEELFQNETVGDWTGCFVVATERNSACAADRASGAGGSPSRVAFTPARSGRVGLFTFTMSAKLSHKYPDDHPNIVIPNGVRGVRNLSSPLCRAPDVRNACSSIFPGANSNRHPAIPQQTNHL
jgi:predicted nuclease of predicted toxin-antitoxin system